MAQVESGDGLGDALGLTLVEPFGTPRLDGAKTTAARADIAEDHKGGRAVVPALADIGAARALADGVQALVSDEIFNVDIVGRAGCFGF